MKATQEKNINSFIIAHHTKVHIFLFYVFIFIYKYIFFLGEPLRSAFGCPRVGLSAPSPAPHFMRSRVVPLLSLSLPRRRTRGAIWRGKT